MQRSLRDGESVRTAQARFYSGAYLLETVPCVLLVLARHARDPEEAIVRAVNDTRDNDTVAAVAGAVVGALHGAQALPRRWREGLLGRVVADGPDGELFEVIGRALDTWLPRAGGEARRDAGAARPPVDGTRRRHARRRTGAGGGASCHLHVGVEAGIWYTLGSYN